MHQPGDKPPTWEETDAAAYALLKQLAQRQCLAHYGPLLRKVLPELKRKAKALAPKVATVATPEAETEDELEPAFITMDGGPAPEGFETPLIDPEQVDWSNAKIEAIVPDGEPG